MGKLIRLELYSKMQSIQTRKACAPDVVQTSNLTRDIIPYRLGIPILHLSSVPMALVNRIRRSRLL